MMYAIYSLALAFLYYIYDGYLRALQLLAIFRRGSPVAVVHNNHELRLTVLITVHNEATQIRQKIANVVDTDFPADRLEVLVASDCSTDGSDDLVISYGDPRVHCFRSDVRGGKTATQNEAMKCTHGDIIVLTDAGTRFDKQFLTHIAAPFSDPRIGAVDGHLLFIAEQGNGLSQSQGYYWDYELRLRTLESQLGLLAVASGACLAVRKRVFVEMDPSVGEDCIVPLDVAASGAWVVHASQALAYDQMDHSVGREIRTRVRMTARNWRGTWMRPALLNPLQYPGYAFALWSHKLLRWLSPFFLIILWLSAATIGATDGGAGTGF